MSHASNTKIYLTSTHCVRTVYWTNNKFLSRFSIFEIKYILFFASAYLNRALGRGQNNVRIER